VIFTSWIEDISMDTNRIIGGAGLLFNIILFILAFVLIINYVEIKGVVVFAVILSVVSSLGIVCSLLKCFGFEFELDCVSMLTKFKKLVTWETQYDIENPSRETDDLL